MKSYTSLLLFKFFSTFIVLIRRKVEDSERERGGGSNIKKEDKSVLVYLFICSIFAFKERIRHAQDTLIKCVRENTNRLELLQVMNKEKKELVKVISSQPKRRENLEKVLQTTAEYNKDVKKLEAILENQNRTMFELRAEIKRLKTKGM